MLPLVLLAIGVFAFLPSAYRARVTTFSAGTNTPAAYSLTIRQGFSNDARRIIARHPWTGVGIGNYASADAQSTAPTDDPHNVLLLQAAEGGYGLAAAFLLLILGTTVVLFRKMRSFPSHARRRPSWSPPQCTASSMCTGCEARRFWVGC